MKLECKRCQYEWYPRNPEVEPKLCPRCKNPNWQTEKPKPKYLGEKNE